MAQQTPTSKFFESILVGTVEAIARAGAKAAESITGDVKKALKNEAFKVEIVEKGIEAWRKSKLGEVIDLHDSTRSERDEKGDTGT